MRTQIADIPAGAQNGLVADVDVVADADLALNLPKGTKREFPQK